MASSRRARHAFRIINMEHESFWEEKKKLPRFMFPQDYSLDPCSTCSGHCCTTIVSVTMVEALRISLGLTLPVDDVVVRVPADSERGQRQTVAIPLDEGEVRLALRRRGESDECLFFHAVGRRGLCSIHAFRPGPCRAFPYQVSDGERVVHAGAPIPCPTRWLFNEEIEARVSDDFQLWLDDIDEERRLVDAWRASGVAERGFADFTTFAVRRLAARYGKDADALLAPPRRRLGERG